MAELKARGLKKSVGVPGLFATPRGVAMVERFLTDADSVVYTKTARGAVELQVQAALGALVEERDPFADAGDILSLDRVERAATTQREAQPQRRPRGGLA
jgi:hypothetical protein